MAVFCCRPMDTPSSSSAISSASAPGRKRRWPRRLLWSTVGLLGAALLASVALGFWIHQAALASLPVLDGELRVADLSAPVLVRRDAHGVPHIDAQNEADLFEAQGYVTAQDRLWQLDTMRRYANGDLAEVFGASGLEHDRVQRVYQIRHVAERIYANLNAADQARLQAYARGVNLFIEQNQDKLPWEFRVYLYRPAPWKPVDSLSVGLSMVEALDTHFWDKLGRERIEARLNNAKLAADLYPNGSWRDRPPTGEKVDVSQPQPEPERTDDSDDEDDRTQTRLNQMGDADELARLRQLTAVSHCAECASGSNNWVVAGAHTASGKPLLANDMHLPLTVPDVWYMADLKAPGLHVAGVTMPGVPGVIEGHNEHIAWGITALYADVQDLYVEQLDGKGHYRAADGQWKPLQMDREVIHVRGGRDKVLNIPITAHGPLLSALLPKDKRAIALQWTLFDPSLNALPIYELNKAANWTEVEAAVASWAWPTQNLVYADDQGHIGYHAVGKVPQRPAGVQDRPIYGAGREWSGYIPFDRLPQSFDPPSGLLATANARTTSAKYPGPLTREWPSPYRAQRIYKMLEGRDHLTPADMLAAQTDTYSEVSQQLGQRFAYAIDHADAMDARMRQAADLLRNWDGRMATDSAAASIVTQTMEALWPMLLEPKIGKKEVENYSWAESVFAQEEIIMRANPDWLPKKYKSWDNFLADAVRKGLDKGHAPRNLTNWPYGAWHVVDIEHPLTNALPRFLQFAGTGPLPLSGDHTTVKQVGRSFGPSQRFTMDWSNVDGSTENIVTGQSGNYLSPHFKDQWESYYNGRTLALPFTDAAVAAQTRHTLRLQP